MCSSYPLRHCVARCAAGFFLLCCMLWLRQTEAQDLLSDEDAGDSVLNEVIADIAAEQRQQWWDKAWRFRRQFTIDDPGLLLVFDKTTVFFDGPDPLLLYNTGRCRRGAADLRLVTANGEALPGGVVNFGQDDGTSLLWCRFSRAPDRLPHVLQLYYGNTDAEPLDERAPDELPIAWARSEHKHVRGPLHVHLGPEETRPGDEPSAAAPLGLFFRDLIVAEAESCLDAVGMPAIPARSGTSSQLKAVTLFKPGYILKRNRTGAGGYLAPVFAEEDSKPTPVEAWTTVQLPEAGRWQVHVRYEVTSYTHVPKSGMFQVYRPCAPFTFILNGAERMSGANQAAQAFFRWDSFTAELPAGENKLGFRMTDDAGPDCVLFTRDPEYLPDHRDVNGPVWMRFKLPDPRTDPFFINLYCVINPWGGEAVSGGYIFRDRVVLSTTDVRILARNAENMLLPGEWSPWVQAPHSGAHSWYIQALFYSGNRQSQILGDRYSMPNVTIAFQFATRPDPARAFREGIEQGGDREGSIGLHVLMPTSLELAQVLGHTLSFGQWARQRWEFVETLNLKSGQGPRSIIATTLAVARSRAETEYILKSCSLLGFNGIRLDNPLPDDEFVELAVRNGFGSTDARHWHPKFDIATLPDKPEAGRTCVESLERFLQAEARKCYAGDRPQWGDPRLRANLVVMGDEIGPAIHADYINALPLFKGAFHEFLQRHGLTPGFFAKENWQAVDALTYNPIVEGSESGDTLARILAARGIEPSSKLPPGPDIDVGYLRASPTVEIELDEKDASEAEEDRQAAARLARLSGNVPLAEKRIYHWTQRFRSWYTTRFYGIAHAELQRVARDELKLPWIPMASPNFQAMPIMAAQMWDGALNLFEWARSGTTDFLFNEDWINDPYRVAFGMGLLRAAGRLRGQKIGHLIVSDRGTGQRFLMALGQGSRAFQSYLYGPLRTIGPAWGDHPPAVRLWADLLRQTGKCEADLLASQPRPAAAAILIANTSEINTAYLSTSFSGKGRALRDRYDIFAALMDAHVPVELVGEEEIIEDEALQRYRALYVADPHVDSRAQSKIKEWVNAGGVLWASHAGLARQEYDQPSTVFDEVFGLASRGPVVAAPDAWDAGAAVEIVVPEGELLPAVTFSATPCKPLWKLGSASVLAHFADGAPALLHNRFGQGQAFLFGNATYTCTGGYGPEVAEPPSAAATRRIVAVAARIAKVRPHLRCTRPRVLWRVLDGPEQTVVIVAGAADKDMPQVSIEVFLPWRPASAYSGRSDALDFKWLGDRAQVTFDLAKGDGFIWVFKRQPTAFMTPDGHQKADEPSAADEVGMGGYKNETGTAHQRRNERTV